MEHYYVISGNEFGVDLSTKNNHLELENAMKFFVDQSQKEENFYTAICHVNSEGKEDIIGEHNQDDHDY